ncbi:hypothetical protein L9F63_026806, partial [Diploptera punctata]
SFFYCALCSYRNSKQALSERPALGQNYYGWMELFPDRGLTGESEYAKNILIEVDNSLNNCQATNVGHRSHITTSTPLSKRLRTYGEETYIYILMLKNSTDILCTNSIGWQSVIII